MALNLGVKIWGDVKGLIEGLKSGEKSLKDFETTTASSMKQVRSTLKALETEYYNVAAAQGKNSQAAINLKLAYDGLNNQAKELKQSLNGIPKNNIFSGLGSEITSLATGFIGISAAVGLATAAFKQAITGAIEQERADRRMLAAMNGNIEAFERFSRFKDTLMNTTLFSEAEIQGAITLGNELGRTEVQTKKMIETAMGLSRVTGQDLNSVMIALSATYDGQTGKLGKVADAVKGLTDNEYANGKAIDILHEKYARLMSEGIGSTEGDLIQLKKWWDETLEGIGFGFLKFAKMIQEGIKLQLLVSGGGTDKYETAALKIEGQRSQIQAIKDNIAAMREQAKADAGRNLYLESLTEKEKKFGGALNKTNSELELYIKHMKDLQAGKVLGPEAPTAGEALTGVKFDRTDAVTKLDNKPVTNLPTGGVSLSGMKSSTDTPLTTVDALRQMSAAMDAIGGRLGGLYGQFTSVFAGISQAVSAAADKSKGKWKGMAEGILSAISGVMSAISSIIADSYAQRQATLDSYYDNEREKINNSTLPEAEKRKRIEKLDKEAEKKRKELQRQQAKDAKAVSIMQAIINGALAVVMALASTAPPANFIMAAIVGALAAVQIALIASQPLPALAAGGLAYGATTALVGEYPNASINPEVITPLDKLKGMLADTVGGGMLTARVTGDDLLFVMERADKRRTRVRGY